MQGSNLYKKYGLLVFFGISPVQCKVIKVRLFIQLLYDKAAFLGIISLIIWYDLHSVSKQNKSPSKIKPHIKLLYKT